MFPKKKENQKDHQQPQHAEDLQKQIIELQRQIESLKKENFDLSEALDRRLKEVESLRKEKDDIFAKLQRVAADYDNYQKRTARQITESIAHERETIAKAMLPVLDNFEHALANTNCSENAEAVLKGVRIVYDQMLDVLKAQGVEQIKAAGERFNPQLHEAIVQRAEPGKEDGVVLEELQKGYRMNGRVIRASRVVVNKAAKEPGLDELSSRRSAEPEPGGQDETKDTQ